MTDQAQGLAPAVGQEPSGSPTPVISPASPAERSATPSPDADAIVEKLLERLKTELDPVVEARLAVWRGVIAGSRSATGSRETSSSRGPCL